MDRNLKQKRRERELIGICFFLAVLGETEEGGGGGGGQLFPAQSMDLAESWLIEMCSDAWILEFN